MNNYNPNMKYLKETTITLLLCSMMLLLSACTSTGESIQTEEDFLSYLSKTYQQDDFAIKDSVEQGNYKLIAFKDSAGRLGLAFLEKGKDETYNIVQMRLTSGDSYLLFQYNEANKRQWLCIVNDGDAEKVVMSVDNQQEQTFQLDKTSPAAYLFPIDYPKAESFGYRFQNKFGENVYS